MPLPKVKITARRQPVVPIKAKSQQPEPGVLKKTVKKVKRRPSFEIARDFVEMNFALLMGPELTPKEAKKAAKRSKKIEKQVSRAKHRLRRVILSTLALMALSVAIAVIWWTTSLQPVNSSDSSLRKFVVDKGASTEDVATALQKAGFIRSSLAYRIYARLNHKTIQAGSHTLSPSYSVPEIADKLALADIDEISVQVLPGLTLKQLADSSVKGSLAQQGFSPREIKEAFAANYSSDILSGRPAGASLEGYIYPDTYRIYSNQKLEDVIEKALARLTDIAAQNDLKAGFASHGLTFHQGLTLASIITKEVTNTNDQKTVAGVFYNRLKSGMKLDSDVTFHYAYNQGLCTVNDPTCISSYNTRLYTGLPSGPIANPTLSAMQAVADPAITDYYYFVAGDGEYTGQTFFAKTLEEHNANVKSYCPDSCH